MPVPHLSRFKLPLALAAWVGLALGFHLLRFDPYDITEAAARAMLLDWTVVDRVTNPVLSLGLPDLRVVLFVPLAIYWTGSIVAVKVFALLIAFLAGLLLYRWACRRMTPEAALIATGLFLIAPLTLSEVNRVGIGPFLLLTFALGQWVDERYREVRRRFGGWYFLQLGLSAVAVSLHPAGIAHPLALMWEWHRNPVDRQHRLLVTAGLGFAGILMLIMRLGWPALSWGDNPMAVLTNLVWVMGPNSGGPSWMMGLIPSMILLLLIASDFRALFDDLFGRMLLGGLLFGAVAADAGWAMPALAILLYRGAHRLIRFNENLTPGGFAGHRGVTLLVVFILATTFMVADKAQRYDVLTGTVGPEDEAIRVLSGEIEDVKEPAITVSQWPGRTMLATRQPTFPLPPASAKEQDLLANLRGVRYLLFDPYDKRNAHLKELAAGLPNEMKTIMITSDAVLVEYAGAERAPSTAAPR